MQRLDVINGSPPRLWGKHSRQPDEAHKSRFTPTPVGKTRRMRRAGRVPPVHPHACGENTRLGWSHADTIGSPPRLWGKRPVLFPFRHALRFTPTPVGKTMKAHQTPESIPVHPHACGENRDFFQRVAYENGSPPRLWGKLSPYKTRCNGLPVHPHACGENCLGEIQELNDGSVHPHACGENSHRSGCGPSQIGSPPRLWGKRNRIACYFCRRAVHPHACGENHFYENAILSEDGSPPRLWGKLCEISEMSGATSVHPHACGENQ